MNESPRWTFDMREALTVLTLVAVIFGTLRSSPDVADSMATVAIGSALFSLPGFSILVLELFSDAAPARRRRQD